MFGLDAVSILNIFTSIALLAVVAVGLYIIFGLMKVINMAHGDMVMLGAYSTFTLAQIGINFWLATILSAIMVGLLGGLIERGIIRFLYKSGNLSTMLATWGVSICLQQIIKLTFGPQGQFVNSPVMSMTSIFGANYPTFRLIMLLICIVVLVSIFIIIKKTKVGLLIRSTMDNAVMAEAMGISTKRVYMYGFIGGSALAGFAGALLSPIASITPLMGLDYVTKSFLVVIVGGVETMLATIGGSFIVAGLQTYLSGFLGMTNSWLVVLLLVVCAIWLRPQGVFTKK